MNLCVLKVRGVEVVSMEKRLVTVSSDGELRVFRLSLVEGQERDEEEEEGSVGGKRKSEPTLDRDERVSQSLNVSERERGREREFPIMSSGTC